METIKKTILQAVTTGTTFSCNGKCRIIIPDLKAIYYIKICLTQEAHDFGFFDVYLTPVYGHDYGDPIGFDNLL